MSDRQAKPRRKTKAMDRHRRRTVRIPCIKTAAKRQSGANRQPHPGTHPQAKTYRHKAGNLVPQALGWDDSNLIADALVGLEVERQPRVVLLDDYPGALLHRLRADATLLIRKQKSCQGANGVKRRARGGGKCDTCRKKSHVNDQSARTQPTSPPQATRHPSQELVVRIRQPDQRTNASLCRLSPAQMQAGPERREERSRPEHPTRT